MNKRKQKKNRQKSRPAGRGRSTKSNPTLVLKAKTLISQNISGVSIKQINIIPNISIFGADILDQMKFYQQYRIARVHVHFLNLVPVNYVQTTNTIELPLVYEVPMTTGVVPAAAQSAYLAYKNLRYFSFRRDFQRSFVPFVHSGDDGFSPMFKAPKLSTQNLNQPHYGLSYLFAKTFNPDTYYSLKAVITAEIELFTYDGNSGVDLGQIDTNPLYIQDMLTRNRRKAPMIQQIQQLTTKLDIDSGRQNDDIDRLLQLVTQLKLKGRGKTQHERLISLRTIQKNPGPDQEDQPPDSQA